MLYGKPLKRRDRGAARGAFADVDGDIGRPADGVLCDLLWTERLHGTKRGELGGS